MQLIIHGEVAIEFQLNMNSQTWIYTMHELSENDFHYG